MKPIEIARKLRPKIEQLAQTMPDDEAVEAVQLFPAWQPDTEYTVGIRVQRNDALWKCRQAHTSQDGWEPEAAASLWEQVDEKHQGTLEEPIPYSGNMELANGLYYSQDGVVYRCIRDSGTPVYHPLSDLIGLYVEAADNNKSTT